MSDIYQRLELGGEHHDSAEIIATLAAIGNGKLKNDLRLLNFYREVPVSYGAQVVTIEKESVELVVHQVQAVVIAHEKLTVLKSSHFPKDVIANVAYANVQKSRVVLTKFSYALVRADRRMSVRVEMEAAIKASFSGEEHQAEGRLHDMSLTGISLKVPHDPGIPLSEKGTVTVALPEETIAVPGSLLKIATDANGCRLAFEIDPDRQAELSISHYIFRRQVEIIKELKDHPGVG